MEIEHILDDLYEDSPFIVKTKYRGRFKFVPLHLATTQTIPEERLRWKVTGYEGWIYLDPEKYPKDLPEKVLMTEDFEPSDTRRDPEIDMKNFFLQDFVKYTFMEDVRGKVERAEIKNLLNSKHSDLLTASGFSLKRQHDNTRLAIFGETGRGKSSLMGMRDTQVGKNSIFEREPMAIKISRENLLSYFLVNTRGLEKEFDEKRTHGQFPPAFSRQALVSQFGSLEDARKLSKIYILDSSLEKEL